jgi:hypothetical protein
MANLVAKAQRDIPLDAAGMCPLMMQTLQLLPVRYGRVENLDPSRELSMPYTLQSRPLGFRLIRDGFLYVIDSSTSLLHEYKTQDGSVVALLFKGSELTANRRVAVVETDPVLLFSRSGTLHVAFSEVQWTAFKCAQVMKVEAEREYFMQQVSFENVQYGKGVDLFDDRHMAVWLAETSNWADKPGETSTQIPYKWEHAPLFRQTILEEFTSQVEGAHKNDFLFLAVRDDVGVMRDLASHQDQVVGQIETWAQSQQGEVERDYLLGCYIESITQINDADLSERGKKDRTLKALLDDLETLPEPERSQTRKTLREVMSQDNRQEAGTYFNDPNPPADLQERLDNAKPDRLSMDDGIEARANTIQQYQLEQRFVGTSPAFIARHRKTLWKLYRQMDKPTKDALYGAKFGQRGINDLIERPRMDAFLKQQRAVLQPLNEELEKITQDRVNLLIKNRLHRAIWYYDIEDSEQVDHALLTEYACLKDICRSDKAVDFVLSWLNHNPAMSRPMFYAAPLSAQTELGTQFAVFTNAGWLLLKEAREWMERLKQWGAGLVLDLERVSPATQVNVSAAWGTLAPALQMGIQQAVQVFLQQMDKGQLPDMDALFRSLPNAAGVAILDAARRENVTFQIASAEDLQNLSKTVQGVQKQRDYLRYLTNYSRENKARSSLWHLGPDATWTKEQRQKTQESLRELEQQLAKAMSPVADLPTDSTHLQAASSGKPGLALVFPEQQQREVRSVLESYRKGVMVAPKAGLLGDGAGLLVFVSQVLNLVVVSRETFSESNKPKELTAFAGSFFATAAAGFGAAQGIADTALGAHAAELAKNLKKAELLGVHVQMGKLHIALGVGGYPAGMAAAAISFNSSHNNWQEAVRNGNSEAQNGAVISMLGNSGFLASNSYGAIQTGMALKNVLATARNSPARIAAWAAAGTRLSTVFLRFNLAGILFTALELSGSWYYNRNNLSRHDYWLLSTPWGKEQDPDQCLSLPLDHYLDELHGHIQAPRMQIIPASNDAPRRFLLHFPMLSAAELTKPISSHASGARLNIGGYQLIREVQGRMGRPERWSPLSDALEDRLYIKQRDPLIVELTDLRGLIKSDLPRHTDIVLSIQLGHITQEGHYDAHVYGVRFPVFEESGDFPTANLDPQGEQCAHFNIDPDLMPKVDK